MHSLGAVDPVLLRSLGLEPGMRVLDVASGIGDPALAIAQWVGPRGSVLGVDISGPMIEAARRRARALGIANVRFRVANIERFRHAGHAFDAIVSRFGIMFVEDVPETLARLHAALRPDGRLAFAIWAEGHRNTAFSIASRVMSRWLETPLPPPAEAPHPMRFAIPGSLPRLLRAAGFRSVSEVEVAAPFVYPDPETFVTVQLETSSSARALYDRVPVRARARVRAAMAREAARHRDGGVVRLPGVARVVRGVK